MNFLYQIFSENLIYALGWTVLHSFWQALAIGLLMAVGMMLLQHKSAKARYELAAFSLFLLFISSLTTFLVYYETAQTTTDFVTVSLEGNTIAAAVTEATALTASSLENYLQYFNQHIPLVVAVWFIGVCFFLVRLMGGLAYIQRLKYTNNKPVSPEWNAKVEQLCKRLRLRKTVKLMESSMATVPMVIGYLKPVILMPIGAINGLNESEVDAILAHELAHVYRNDFLLNIFLSAIEVLFYFNPAVWWIAANIRTERENCCDDIAIKLCGDSLAYAKALLSLQEISQAAPGYAMAFAGPKNQLLHRIKRILSQPQTKSNMFEKFTATCLLMITMVLCSIGANSYNYNKNIQQQFFANEMSTLMAAENTDEGYFDLTAKKDTTPKNKRQRYIKKSDDGEVELEIEEGNISKLIIDGEQIPDNELSEYDELIDGLINEMESVPSLNHKQSATPNQQSKKSPFDHRHTKTITTETEDNGQTRIVIQSNGDEPTEIILNNGQEFIFIDGTRLEGGDTAVIIDEKSRISILEEKRDFTKHRKTLDPDQTEQIDKDIQSTLDNANLSMEEVIEERIAEMEERIQELRNRQEEVQLNAQRLREENLAKHEDRMTKHREEMAERRVEMAERREEMNLKREMIIEEQNAKREEHRHRIETMQENTADVHADQTSIHFNDQIKNSLVQEMIKDGLVKNENNYSFELTKQYLKINKDQQSDIILKKYLDLYEKESGHPFNIKGQIKYKTKNGNSKSSVRTFGFIDTESLQQYNYYFSAKSGKCRMSMVTPKRIDNLETLSFFITPIKLERYLTKLS